MRSVVLWAWRSFHEVDDHDIRQKLLDAVEVENNVGILSVRFGYYTEPVLRVSDTGPLLTFIASP